ncbi:MAG: hypothetical protein Q9159_005476 [Coniocarpon cinnabarinum]
MVEDERLMREESKQGSSEEHKEHASKPENASPQPPVNGSQKQNRLSWRKGSWRGKATAVAEIAKESIPGNNALKINTKRSDASRKPSHRLSQSLGSPGKSTTSPASATPITVASDASSEVKDDSRSEKDTSTSKHGTENGEKKVTAEQQPMSTGKDGNTEDDTARERSRPASGWRGWWSRPANQDAEQHTAKGTNGKGTEPEAGTKSAIDGTQALNTSTGSNVNETEPVPDLSKKQEAAQDDPNSVEATVNQTKSAKSNRSSWFGLWGSSAQPESTGSELERRASATKGQSVEPSPTNVDASSEPSNPSATGETVRSQLTSRPASGSWAFWSRERPTDDQGKATGKSEQNREIGELAVSGTDSQSKPRPAQLNEEDESKQESSKKRQRPESTESVGLTSKKKAAAKPSASTKQTDSGVTNEQDAQPSMQQSVLRTTIEPPKPKSRNASKEKAKAAAPPNAIYPSFADTYPLAQPTSYISRLSRYLPYIPATSEPKHLSRMSQPHRIRRALAIGVHGYFPTALIQKVLGPPTGTSIKFADSAAAAIQQYCSLHACTADIDKVALEGEGTVDQRIESLWKLLLNWIDAIRKSDFILVACHSQGVPVAVGLVARLLSFGCVQKDARIGICAMAGVNQGPFSSYQSRFLPLGASGTELFDFAQPNSAVSAAYTNSLNTCLRHHVRILYIGSLDDQLVSVESSTYTIANHPYISRAVFVDGREHPDTADFLTRLVGFGLRLRNLGISDHGLIRELSGPLAGSLYSGEGHSRIYDEDAVYDLAVRLAAETESLDSNSNPHLDVNNSKTVGESNPFFLPWALRGVLEEEEVKSHMKGETDELLRLFEQWRPQSRTLRDVRFRLEAVRSKL